MFMPPRVSLFQSLSNRQQFSRIFLLGNIETCHGFRKAFLILKRQEEKRVSAGQKSFTRDRNGDQIECIEAVINHAPVNIVHLSTVHLEIVLDSPRCWMMERVSLFTHFSETEHS